MKKSMYLNYTDSVPATARAEAVAAAGFDGAELFRYQDNRESLATQAAAVRATGMEVDAVHADFKFTNYIWIDCGCGDRTYAFLERCVKEAGDCGIPHTVVHVSSGILTPDFGEKGLERFRRLCEAAEAAGTAVAFENLRKTAYLDYVLENIPQARFCFDCGHELIYNGGEGVLEKNANRLACVHLHDNDGKKDKHFLPFDGVMDWHKMARRLKAAGVERLTFEVFCKYTRYKEFPLEVMQKAVALEQLM